MNYLNVSYGYGIGGKTVKWIDSFLCDRQQCVMVNRVIFIAGRPKAALLLWFFGDFRCGALLFVVIHVIYKYKNR